MKDIIILLLPCKYEVLIIVKKKVIDVQNFKIKKFINFKILMVKETFLAYLV